MQWDTPTAHVAMKHVSRDTPAAHVAMKYVSCGGHTAYTAMRNVSRGTLTLKSLDIQLGNRSKVHI